MSNVFKKGISLVLCFTMLLGFWTSGICSTKANAATFDEINNPDIFYQGKVSGPCNLAALTMLLRRVYIAQGKDWTTVTQSSVKSACCPSGSYGPWYSSNYNGISISHKSFSGGDSTLRSLLAKHPEGIVLYNGGTGGVYHGVLVTDYTDGTFYCADYNYGSPSGRIPLSSVYGKYVTANNATEYWYVSSPSISLDEKYTLKVFYNANGGSITSDDYKLSSNVVYNKSDSTKYYQKWTYNNPKDYGLVNASIFGIYKNGYTFAGWGTEPTGGTVLSSTDSSIVPTDITSDIKNGDCSVTLYAQWEPNSLKVYYNANGGSIKSDSYKLSSGLVCNKSDSSNYYQTWTYNKTKTDGLKNASTLGVYKTGYTFIGWSTKSTGGTVFSSTDSTIVPTDLNSNIKNGNCSITLYAQWEPNTLKVYYNANGGSIKSDDFMINSNTIYNKADSTKYEQNWTYNKSKDYGLVNAYVFGLYKTGYTFEGWGTKSTGGTILSSTDNSIIPTEINSNIQNGDCSITLYAQWKPNTLKVYYNANGGSIKSDDFMINSNTIYNKADSTKYEQTWTYNKSKDYGLVNAYVFGLYKTGYTFKGWGTESTGGTILSSTDNSIVPTEINSNIKNGDCTITLYAIWEKNPVTTYTLSYNTNGGSTPPANQTGATSYTISLTKPTRSGYTFLGWSKSSSATTASYKSGDNITLTSNTTLYAVWQNNTVVTPPANKETISVAIRNPSTTSIIYGDKIILHADLNEDLPECYHIEWSVSNANFTYTVSDDGNTCTISPSLSGSTTFTATVYDEKGDVVSSDEQVMTSKAGFFRIIIAFFKILFGLTKVIPQAIK